jgi:hypothetical protein
VTLLRKVFEIIAAGFQVAGGTLHASDRIVHP